jgi:site-specific DNA-cytosine methylase
LANGLTVLSLFDGMSCGQIALERAGIEVDKYFASEIDKYAMQVTMKNYSNTTQLGDVTNWRDWSLPEAELLIGGSPCQGFSFAGKGLNFDDPRSKLFFEYVDILKTVRPKYFLLENVKMKNKQWEDIITQYVGVEPIEINSSLVSAQNRVRLYWTNIPGISQPQDKGINLIDIFDFHEQTDWEKKFSFPDLEFDGPYLKIDRKGNIKTNQLKSGCLTGGHRGDGNHSDMDLIVSRDGKVRRYSPGESEKLQTVPSGYTAGVSNTQRYKMLSNGWTVDVIAHLFSHLNVGKRLDKDNLPK